ncbi:CGG triplet repeat-binding protein 1-like, partial [Aphis craccivora]
SNFYEICQNLKNLQDKKFNTKFSISFPSNSYRENSKHRNRKNFKRRNDNGFKYLFLRRLGCCRILYIFLVSPKDSLHFRFLMHIFDLDAVLNRHNMHCQLWKDINCLRRLNTSVHAQTIYHIYRGSYITIPASNSARLKIYISENEDVFSTDNQILFCKLCDIRVNLNKRFTVNQHLKTAKHLRAVNRLKTNAIKTKQNLVSNA